MKGHLHVAKWLLQVKPNINISAQKEDAFRWACLCKHLPVAQWLQSLMPFKYIIINNNNRPKPIIRSNTEANTLALITLFEKKRVYAIYKCRFNMRFCKTKLICIFFSFFICNNIFKINTLT